MLLHFLWSEIQNIFVNTILRSKNKFLSVALLSWQTRQITNEDNGFQHLEIHYNDVPILLEDVPLEVLLRLFLHNGAPHIFKIFF